MRLDNGLSVPFSSGQWLLHRPYRAECRTNAHAFSPFSSGQWLLLLRMALERRDLLYILSVRFSSRQWLLHGCQLRWQCGSRKNECSFQSAFHRGNGCYKRIMQALQYVIQTQFFSVRFSSRQWLLLDIKPNQSAGITLNAFSPLFIGAMVATTNAIERHGVPNCLSVRFSSRQWLLLYSDLYRSHYSCLSVPFHRGNGCY